VEKQKARIAYPVRLWRLWQRKSLWIYAAGVVYLLFNLLMSHFTVPVINESRVGMAAAETQPTIPATGYIVLSRDETGLLGLLALVTGFVMLAAVIGDVTYRRRWIRGLALFMAVPVLWYLAALAVVGYALTPRTDSLAHGEHVYHLAFDLFSRRTGFCGDSNGICGGDDYQFFECNSLALMCLPKGDVFYATSPRLEIVDGVLRVVRYKPDGKFVDVVYEVTK
jgi:hypothetical protein